MNYIREGDTLIITRLDRLARSVVHLAQLVNRFQTEKINLLVLEQNIDTSTSTGRLMFNMLASIAEFENDLRTERQAEEFRQVFILQKSFHLMIIGGKIIVVDYFKHPFVAA